MAKKIRITETVLRDAHQSLLATRMTLDDMRKEAEKRMYKHKSDYYMKQGKDRRKT